jgi:hypothetical protein
MEGAAVKARRDATRAAQRFVIGRTRELIESGMPAPLAEIVAREEALQRPRHLKRGPVRPDLPQVVVQLQAAWAGYGLGPRTVQRAEATRDEIQRLGSLILDALGVYHIVREHIHRELCVLREVEAKGGRP